MDALILDPSTASVSLRQIPTPTPAAGEVLVRVHAIALNPVDSLYVEQPIAATERVIGTDFAGVVAAVGERAGRVVGERVAGFAQGACSTNPRPGAFAAYTPAPADLLWRIPSHMSFTQAAAVSMCGLTAAQGLFYRLGLPVPPGFPTPAVPNPRAQPPIPVHAPVVLIYAASTSLGMYALQLARRAAPHATLVAVASPKHAHFLRAAPYSADIVLDYRDAGWPDAVVARGGAHYALDCISEGGTVARVHSALADAARLAVFRGPVGGGYDPHLRVAPVYGAVWEGLGVEVGYNDSTLPASPAARAFAAAFNAYLTTHPLINNPVRLLPGGLSRVVEDGFALLGGAKVADRAMSGVRPISGEKVVFELVNED